MSFLKNSEAELWQQLDKKAKNKNCLSVSNIIIDIIAKVISQLPTGAKMEHDLVVLGQTWTVNV